jgi:DNA-binding MarR family transcriptional regulator
MSDGDLPGLLALTFRAVMDQVHERIAEEGFTDVRPAHGFAFQYLSVHGGATAVELGEHLGITKQAAVQLVDDLVGRGYVERTAHPTDRRSRLIVLTAKGWRCIERVVAHSRDVETHWADLIGTERLAQLRNGLLAYVDEAARHRQVTFRPVW